jgi:hypothetical protein
MDKSLANRAGNFFDVDPLERRALLSADSVLDWNAVALQAVADDYTPAEVSSPDQGGPTKTARALAIVHAAIFDAVNMIDRSYTAYIASGTAPRGASIDAAVARAAHDTLVALYPKQTADFDQALRRSLRQIPDGQSETDGVTVGRRVARQILQAREDDHSAENVPYPVPPQGQRVGIFQTYAGEPGALGPGWGNVHAFTMPDDNHFIARQPPALNSAAYAAAYNEVKRLGGDGVTTPTDRTPEQTEIGIFWGYDGTPELGTPPRLYNQIARKIANKMNNTEVQNARLFALINLSMADAGVASWATKYQYTMWRPVRGIRQTDTDGTTSLNDGNPNTQRDRNWTPLGAPSTNGPAGSKNFTPPFPSYTSGHATFGAALFQTLTRFYGRDNISFTFTSDEYNGVNKDVSGAVRPLKPRSFTSFSQASDENGQSRIYLGIHWAFDKTAGIAQGNKIANWAYDHFLQPVDRTLAAAVTDPVAPQAAAPASAAPTLATVAPALAPPALSAATTTDPQWPETHSVFADLALVGANPDDALLP